MYLHSAEAWLQSYAVNHASKPMWKLILLVLIIWLVITIIKRSLAITSDPKSNKIPETQTAKQSQAEHMVQCSICKVHLPRSEAFLVEGKFYCSQPHIDVKPD